MLCVGINSDAHKYRDRYIDMYIYIYGSVCVGKRLRKVMGKLR